ncbi:MAG: hypothetical protein MRY57_01110 [Candidatus Pacebacteria bacterium]|nr:hypothetical protein [Candidatus Paceibacterota bacterium]
MKILISWIKNAENAEHAGQLIYDNLSDDEIKTLENLEGAQASMTTIANFIFTPIFQSEEMEHMTHEAKTLFASQVCDHFHQKLIQERKEKKEAVL